MPSILESWCYYNNDSLHRYTCGSQIQLNRRIAWVILENTDTRTLTAVPRGGAQLLVFLKSSPGAAVQNRTKHVYHSLVSISQKQCYRIILTTIIEIITPIRTSSKSILFSRLNLENDQILIHILAPP